MSLLDAVNFKMLVAALPPDKLVAAIDVPKLLAALSPSGALADVTDTNEDLDKILGEIDADEQAAMHAKNPGVVARLENDFALLEPVIDAETPQLEALAIPILSALAGPGAPFLSFGLTVAVKVALVVYDHWAAKRRLAGG